MALSGCWWDWRLSHYVELCIAGYISCQRLKGQSRLWSEPQIEFRILKVKYQIVVCISDKSIHEKLPHISAVNLQFKKAAGFSVCVWTRSVLTNEYTQRRLLNLEALGFVRHTRKRGLNSQWRASVGLSRKREASTISISLSDLILGLNFNRALIHLPSQWHHQLHPPPVESGHPEENDEEGTFSFLCAVKILSTFFWVALFWVTD